MFRSKQKNRNSIHSPSHSDLKTPWVVALSTLRGIENVLRLGKKNCPHLAVLPSPAKVLTQRPWRWKNLRQEKDPSQRKGKWWETLFFFRFLNLIWKKSKRNYSQKKVQVWNLFTSCFQRKTDESSISTYHHAISGRIISYHIISYPSIILLYFTPVSTKKTHYCCLTRFDEVLTHKPIRSTPAWIELMELSKCRR